MVPRCRDQTAGIVEKNNNKQKETGGQGSVENQMCRMTDSAK